ncbi:5-(carboxyamino)imidazole ribonucleotide synthase [Bacillus solimangrovi]|uniref:N5-carboxyaminoimidazole ribonucleotide synthase n=1 Tax=Bacillus solimangrovi TaxID=1305675 RepID=A0A1E5LH81_9BACI|nr:5-(carboxyamino)imidazole ribonucleotide synthase [Bacillus solimangrovi]OEH93406.1 5-(carboxyamino)imidazole ribonucleotide synthase [Bacillus solimangrovi]
MRQILPGQTIGILGGGQLGRMMALAAKEMGYRIAVLEPKEDSPTAQVADIEIIAPYDDLDAAKRLAEVSDVITYEFENIDHEVLMWLNDHANLPQGSELIRITQDRLNEKQEIINSGAQVAPFVPVQSEQELLNALNKIKLPAVLKTRQGGYDGKGQVMIRNKHDILEAIKLATSVPCILEQFLNFDKEISVIVSRNATGEVATFPVAENIHVEHILAESIVPARISSQIETKAEQLAIELACSINMVGTLAVEMFLTKDGEIYINELAPRPHNSGHYTLDACETSQFQQHIRAICNWPLGKTNLLKPVVMANILGEHLNPVLSKIHAYDNCKLHLYGKSEPKVKRKMGHLNVLADDTGEALRKIEELGIWEAKKEKGLQLS